MTKLLVVDDLDTNRYMLETLLKACGYGVTTAANGAQALELARRNPPDLIVTDILMPVMDGFTLCRAWKSDKDLSDIPLVFYTATYTEDKDRDLALSLGAAEFIKKPMDPAELVGILKQVIGNHEVGKLEKSPAPVVEERIFLKEYNEALIHKLEDKMASLEEANLRLGREIAKSQGLHAELLQSEEKFSKVFRFGPICMAISTLNEGTHLDVNNVFTEVTGYAAEEVKGKSSKEIGLFRDIEDRRMGIEILKQGGSLREFMVDYVRRGGEVRAGLWSAERIVLAGRECVISSLMDITDKKQAVEAMRTSEERYRVLAEAVADAIIVYDLEGNVTYVNPAFTRDFGWSCQEVMGKPMKFVPEDRAAADKARLMRVIQGEKCLSYETRRYTKSGETLEVSISAASFHGAKGEPAGVVVSLHDITQTKKSVAEQEKLLAQLRQAQRMEAIGTLAGGIAHDFNNILGAILGYTELSLLSVPEGSQFKTNLLKVREAGLRAKDLVSQILAFSRQAEKQSKPVNLRHIVEEVAQLLDATTPPNIELRRRLECDGLIMGDASQIHQVVMNLCTNALQAMGREGGVLGLYLSETEIGQATSTLLPDLEGGPYARLVVSDSGHGIDRETQGKIFDPFFTTKQKGEGTGLGLSVVHGIVSSHKGVVTVYSVPGEGSSFHVYLPLLKSAVTGQVGDPMAEVDRTAGSEKVLLVDDEDLLVDIGRQLLGHFGYQITALTSSLRAMELFKEDPRRFDLVITDLHMPKMNGYELSAELLKIRPDIPIILCTGFSDDMSGQMSTSIGIRKVVMKPMVVSDILLAMREVLGKK